MYDTLIVTDLRIALGVRIEELRIAARLTRAQLAELIGIDSRQVAAYELEGGWPGPEMALSLVTAFGIDVRDLYDFTSTRMIPKLAIDELLSVRAERKSRRSSRQR